MASYFQITTEPKSQKHICWLTKRYFDGRTECIKLVEIVESTYAHPDAPEFVNVAVMESVYHKGYPIHTIDAAPLLLLEANEQTINLLKNKRGANDIS
jgi:hypothetical protein